MAVSLAAERKISFYSSPNLSNGHISATSDLPVMSGAFGNAQTFSACQRLDATQSIWALKVGLNPGAPNGGSGEQIFSWKFRRYKIHSIYRTRSSRLDNYGKDDYCAISFNNLRSRETILIGWMNNWQYADSSPRHWRGQIGLPRRLSFFAIRQAWPSSRTQVITPLRELTSYFPLNDSTKAKSIDPHSNWISDTQVPLQRFSAYA